MENNTKQKVILLVDDDNTNNFICRKMFQIYDPSIKTIEFMDPEAALDFLKNNTSDQISLLLLDINMPKMSGWQFLDSMDEDMHRSDVIILTSSIDPKDQQKAQRSSYVKDYWAKPLSLDILGKYFATA